MRPKLRPPASNRPPHGWRPPARVPAGVAALGRSQRSPQRALWLALSCFVPLRSLQQQNWVKRSHDRHVRCWRTDPIPPSRDAAAATSRNAHTRPRPGCRSHVRGRPRRLRAARHSPRTSRETNRGTRARCNRDRAGAEASTTPRSSGFCLYTTRGRSMATRPRASWPLQGTSSARSASGTRCSRPASSARPESSRPPAAAGCRMVAGALPSSIRAAT